MDERGLIPVIQPLELPSVKVFEFRSNLAIVLKINLSQADKFTGTDLVLATTVRGGYMAQTEMECIREVYNWRHSPLFKKLTDPRGGGTTDRATCVIKVAGIAKAEWYRPIITRIDLKRTLNNSGTYLDFFASTHIP